MSLNLHLKHFQGVKGKGEKISKVTFRGASHYSRTLEEKGELCTVDQHFEWPIARHIESGETLEVHLLGPSRYLGPKVLGTFCLILHSLVREGRLHLTECLLDSNRKPMQIWVTVEIRYQSPDGRAGGWSSEGEGGSEDEQQRLLTDIETNIQHLESSLAAARRQEQHAAPVNRSHWTSSTLRSVRGLVKLGKHRKPWRHREAGDGDALLSGGEEPNAITNPPSRPSSVASSSSDVEGEGSERIEGTAKKRWRSGASSITGSTTSPNLRAQDFQVCVTIIEARQLAGLNMDPVVCVQVGEQKKYTSVKESTNCPYYNEYFVFDFHMSPVMLFDKIITLTVLHSRKFLRTGVRVGSFKIGVKTVWDAKDHQFYHKWALLTDPDDLAGGPKGYLKVDICVVGKGDNVRVPPKSEKDEDDIEANLLVPDGMVSERQRARFVVRVYRADGLPKMNSDLVANVKRALTGEKRDLVDPYVRVAFAGLSGQTTVRKNSYAPVWNEQIVFTEMFPPLCQRIKIQLRDLDPVNDTVIGTYFIDLPHISNDGEKGFLPTFGPAFLHLYGSTREYSLIDELSPLNEGMGEGVAYRGRILVAIRAEVSEALDLAPSEVEIEPILPVNESLYGKSEEFLLFGCIFEASMLERKISDRPVYFELSVGNAGNAMDGYNNTAKEMVDTDGNGTLEIVTVSPQWQSGTSPMKPMTHDKFYYYMPYWENKPCMRVKCTWPDQRRRHYNSNVLARIAEKMEECMTEVGERLSSEDPKAEAILSRTLDDLCQGCNRYVTLSRGAQPTTATTGAGRTKLDKERIKLCIREIEQMGNQARFAKNSLNANSLREKYKTAHTLLKRLQFLVEDPQEALPDVFLWLISGGKRTAYYRVPARDILYSTVEEECGKFCGRTHTVFMKLPGRRSEGSSGWAVQAEVRLYLWLGLTKHKNHFPDRLPKGFQIPPEIKNVDKPGTDMPGTLTYTDKHTYQMRAHMYQARSLIGSDSSGLSDPFARVIFGEHSRNTQVIDETLSPTWDELLLFEDLQIYGERKEIQTDPPMVVVEVFDQDKVGKAEFIGRAVARPHVILADEQYRKPSLEWYDLYRGGEQAGELLAAFELIEIIEDESLGGLPPLPAPKESSMEGDTGPILPVPWGVRPTLSKYRIEVLFWGLRELKRINFMSVDQPRVDIECCGRILQSSIIANARRNPNFSTPVKFLELELPEQELYCPPLTIRAVDCRSFGRDTLVGTHTIASLHRFVFTPLTRRDRQLALLQVPPEGVEGLSPTYPWEQTLLMQDAIVTKRDKTEANRRRKQSITEEVEEDEDSWDWWSKYFASVENMIEESKEARTKAQLNPPQEQQPNGSATFVTGAIGATAAPTDPHEVTTEPDGVNHEKRRRLAPFKKASTAARIAARLSPKSPSKTPKSRVALVKIFPNELESEAGMEGFKEWLHTFPLYRGKKTGDDLDDEARVVGKFKGAIKVYKWPLPKDLDDHTVMGFDPQYGFFQGLPSNDPIHVLVRVYIVKAHDLHPMDLNGKADPYIVLQLGSKRISDKENYISKQLNPVFGKCFEFEATFPQDSLLVVQVFDWDLVGTDDLIGETRVDLENRFYSRHRATCGLACRYETTGYNQWRDPMRPSQILARLCKEGKVDGPHYSPGRLKVATKTFTMGSNDLGFSAMAVKNVEEHLALNALQHWHEIPRVGCPLVPEHVETRVIFNPEKPGIEQGKVEMWVDLFPMDMPLPGPPLDISPRKPKSYELRVIVWNTEDVVLEDDAFFTGEKMSDIYVKGWLKGPEDCQCTDIHYRSLTGEGNFNWRFCFPFEYLVAEEKIVISRKESLFSWDETEVKIPARLQMQVWDADHFSADDFLGAITLDLNRFPRGAKSAKQCTLDMLKTDGSVPTVNIFKQRRLKGWWPFFVKKDNEELELTGKVEAEIHLLTREEAEKIPVGLGRNEPDPLDKPNRPDSSFMWFLNPLKSIRYIVWHNYKWTIIKGLIFIAVAILFILFFYSVPGYSAKRLVGA